MPELHLKYYMLDWDDNILYMPTTIRMMHHGVPVDVTTKQFAEVRHDPNYRPINDSWDEAFAQFRDGSGDFVADTRQAIVEQAFAPSFAAFKRALLKARLFCIVTARGHSAATIRRGVETVIDQVFSAEEHAEMLRNIQAFNQHAGLEIPDELAFEKYLDLNGYVGVSSPGFLKIFQDQMPDSVEPTSERAKTVAVAQFVAHTLALAQNLPARTRYIAFGFSDDDHRNLQVMRQFLSETLVEQHPDVAFFVYNTSDEDVEVEKL